LKKDVASGRVLPPFLAYLPVYVGVLIS